MLKSEEVRCYKKLENNNAERQGFEPWIGVAYTRFPGVRLQPLGHLSVRVTNICILKIISRYFTD